MPTVQLLDEGYLDKYYKQPWGPRQRSTFDVELQCMADPELKPFRSKSQDIRVIAGQTAIFHTVGGRCEAASALWLCAQWQCLLGSHDTGASMGLKSLQAHQLCWMRACHVLGTRATKCPAKLARHLSAPCPTSNCICHCACTRQACDACSVVCRPKQRLTIPRRC